MTNKTKYHLLAILLLLAFGIYFTSCKEDRITTDPKAKLNFSTDTVLFDTLFTTLGSATKNFRVYNNNTNSLKIKSIRLAGGKNSPYRINVDGEASYSISDYTVLPGDSFYIFVDVKIDPNQANLPFLVKDSIIFETNGNLQDIKLVTYGQNAHFFNREIVTSDTTWSNADNLPIVIMNYVYVPRGAKLTVKEGVKVYSNNNAIIFVAGELNIEGVSGNPAVFQGVRLEEYYKDNPGQWRGIRIAPGGVGNIKEAVIRNANVGVEVDSLPVGVDYNLVLENVKIENMAAVGILGYTAHIQGFNVLVDNCCQYLMVGELGGKYEFYQSTFGHVSCVCFSNDPAFAFANTDYEDQNGIITVNDLDIIFSNSIIWGSKDNEIDIANSGKGDITVAIDHTILKTDNADFNINNNILNLDPKFVNECNYNFELDTLSPALGKGGTIPVQLQTQLQNDLNGNPRDLAKPDLGAFER